MEDEILEGKYVRLEPLRLSHVADLVSAAAGHEELYKWTFVPQGEVAMRKYVQLALDQKATKKVMPFVVISQQDGQIKGSTRFWNMEYWAWPEGHQRHGRQYPDVCEIGHTWLAPSATRTGINTEAKLLLLGHAFEYWTTLRVNFQTDVRNERSQAAIERLGAKLEGVIRAERLGVDLTVRDSARYSIVSSEWPDVKVHLMNLLEKYQ